MTFEEFFQKKRIDLTRLQADEPALFFEFKTHFEQMGEKSFDHTKKYWFNKLRLQYHLASEQKPEKMHLENRLAEQTITETLTESIPAPGAKKVESADSKAEGAAEATAPKPAFKPRFNPKMVAPKAAEDTESVGPKSESPIEETPAEAIAPKPGFKPRFNMKMAPKPAEPVEDKAEEATEPKAQPLVEETPDLPAEATSPKPGFKPRFNMKMAPKPAEAEQPKIEDEAPVAESAVTAQNEVKAAPPAEEPPQKPAGFKPRFNAAKMKPKPPQE